MKIANSTNTGICIIIFISPLLGLYLSIKKLRWEYKKWALIFFITVFGSIMILPNSADSIRHQERVYTHYQELSFAQFSTELWQIIKLNPSPQTNDDVYIHIVSYLIGGVIGFPKIFFAVVAFIFGYFYITALSKILLWNNQINKSIFLGILAFLFIIFCGIDTMQSVRTWTGGWVLFNGVLGYLESNRKRYILLILSAPLIHVAYFVIAAPLLIILIIKKVPSFVIISIFIASFFINLNQVFFIQQFNKSELGKSKVESYYKQGSTPWERMESHNKRWYAKYGKVTSLHWGTFIIAGTIILSGLYNRKKMTSIEFGLFSTGLILAALANTVENISALYNRTLINAGLYILATLILLLIREKLLHISKKKLSVIKVMLGISIIVFIPKVVFTFVNLLYFTSIYIFALPMLAWVSTDLNFSIRDMIDWLI